MIDFGLLVARWFHYVATTTLAGGALFPLYAYASVEPAILVRGRTKVLLVAALVALLSGLVWFAFAVANMSGGLADVANAETLLSVLRDTGFGMVWAARMLLATALVVMTAKNVLSPARIGRNVLTPLLAAALLVSLADTGHSQMEEGLAGAVHIASDAAHLLAAGAWLGGLVPLGFLLGRKTNAALVDIDGILMRFSGVGYAAVATLVGTGLVNSWFLVGSVSALLRTSYGQILLGKLTFFVGMLVLAAANRFWLVPALQASRARGAGGSDVWRRKLRTHVLAEQGLGLLVILSVSVLGTIRPALGQ
jgi:putative copper resistance protein D